MTDTQADATQADADAQSQADTHDGTESQADQSISLDEAKKLRSEAAGLRRRLKEAEAKAQAAENAGKSEDEQRAAALKAAEEKISVYETRLRDATSRTAVYEAATKANAINATAIVRLVRDDLEFDDDGSPVNVAQAVAAAKRDYPELFRATQGSADGGKGTGAANTQDINSLIRSMAGEAR